MILPWHQQAWSRFLRGTRNIHHGQLVVAPTGTGLEEFCVRISRYLLCSEPDTDKGSWCGKCQSCRLFAAHTHPDFHLVTTEQVSRNERMALIPAYSARYQDAESRQKKARPSRIIPIDQIRKLIERFSTHAHISARKVALFIQADRLNINASNAFLKLLEEPPEGSVFILATSEPSRLPKTVISRCVRITLPSPDPEQSASWLEEHVPENEIEKVLSLSRGRPFAARSMHESGDAEIRFDTLSRLAGVLTGSISALDAAAALGKIEFEEVLQWVQGFTGEIIKWKQAGVEPWWQHDFVIKPNGLCTRRLFGFYDKVVHYRSISRGSINEQLALEELLIFLHKTAQTPS